MTAVGRIALSAFILLLLVMVCIYVPQARAEAASADQYGALSAAAEGLPSGSLADASGSQTPATGSGDASVQSPGGAIEPGTPKAAPADSATPVTSQPTTGLVTGTPATGTAPADPDPPQATNCVAGSLDEKCYELHLYCNWGSPGIYWASKADYLAGLLSIDYKLENKGTGDAINIVVTSATATNGVTVWTKPLPDLGTLLSGESIVFTLKWLVPAGVGSFVTDLNVCADCKEEHKIDGDGDDGNRQDIAVDPGNVPPQALSASILPSALPNTGFSLTHAFLVLTGIAALAALMTASAGRLIRTRRK